MEKIDRIIEKVRFFIEEGPTMSLSSGKIAGTVEAGDDPPVDYRRKKYKKIPFFYRDLIKKLKK
jgi:hypothetical protein